MQDPFAGFKNCSLAPATGPVTELLPVLDDTTAIPLPEPVPGPLAQSQVNTRWQKIKPVLVWLAYFGTIIWWLTNCLLGLKNRTNQPSNLDYLPAALQLIVWIMLAKWQIMRLKSLIWLISLLFEVYIAINVYASLR